LFFVKLILLTGSTLPDNMPGTMARPKTGIERVQTGLRLRPELLKVLRHLAIDQGRPYSALVEDAIEDYLEKLGVEVPPPEAPEE